MNSRPQPSKQPSFSTIHRVLLILWLVIVAGVGSYGALLLQQGAKVQSDILAMLPKLKQDPLTSKALAQVEQQLADQVYLAVIAKDKQTAITSAKQIMASLAQDPNKAFVQIQSAGIDNKQQLGQWFFEHRFNLLTPFQAKAFEQQDLTPLIKQAQRQLFSAFGFANSQMISRDPLLLFAENMLSFTPNSQLTTENDILLHQTVNDVAAIVIAKGAQSAFSPSAQQQQLHAINHAISNLDNNITVLKAGALFHAKAATDAAKREISTIGSLSLLGVVLLVFMVFRTFMPLVLAMLTLTVGVLCALVATIGIFGEIHLLTLVFGTSLIGVAIDYSFHFYGERLNVPQHNAQNTIRTILPALTLALTTSMLAFIAIGFTPFPGMQQVAVFCATGLLGAYCTLVMAFPTLANHALKPSRYLDYASQYLLCVSKIAKLKYSSLITIVSISLLLVLGLSQLTHNDDIRLLQQSPESILEEENQVRLRLSGGTDNQFIVLSAPTEQAVLSGLHSLDDTLKNAINAGELTHFFSFSQLIPSIETQQHNYQLQAQLYQQLTPVLTELGISDNGLATSLQSQYLLANNQYLTISGLLEHSGDQFTSLWLPATNEQPPAAIVMLSAIKDLPVLKARVNQLQLNSGQVKLVDKVGDISATMGHYRHLTLVLLALVLGIAALVFCLKYRGRKGLWVVGLPFLAMLLTLATLGLIGSPLTLFHALALILILGISIDYSLFFAEAKQQTNGVMLAVFMSAISTLLAFGLLSLSQTHAIHFFGLTLLLGICYSLMLTPFMTFLNRKNS